MTSRITENPFWRTVLQARRPLVVTGAGISHPAGLPLYRQGQSRSWTQADLETKMHASRYGSHLPELWRHWWPLIEQARSALPTDSHLLLTKWQQELAGAGGRLTLVTTNVDGLHAKAGSHAIETPSRPTDGSDAPPQIWLPKKKRWSTKTRPDVTLFGEMPSPSARRALEQAISSSDLLVVVGSSGNVWPLAGLPKIFRDSGRPTVLVNRVRWTHHDFTHEFLGDADDVLGP